MKRYGITDAATGMIKRIVMASDPDQAMLNCPQGCTPDVVGDSVMPGYRKMGGKFYPPVEQAFSLTDMIATIDAERDARSQVALTPGLTKSIEYAEKARERREVLTLGTVLASAQMGNLPWIAAEMAESGDSLQTVINRIGAGITGSALAPKIAARAQKLKRQLRAAPDTATRQTIFLSRTWPTS